MMAQVSAPYQPFDITLQVWRQAFQQIERLSDSFLDTAKKAAHVAFAVLLSIGSVAFDLVVSTITVIQWFTRSALLPQAPSLDPAPPPYDPKSLSFAPSAPPQQMLFSSEKMSQILQGQGNLYKKDFSKITESQFIRDALNQAFHCLEKADKASYQALIDDDGAPLQDHLTEFTDIHSWVAKCYLAHYLLYYSANPKTFLIFESMPNALRTTLQAALSIDQVKQTLIQFVRRGLQGPRLRLAGHRRVERPGSLHHHQQLPRRRRRELLARRREPAHPRPPSRRHHLPPQ